MAVIETNPEYNDEPPATICVSGVSNFERQVAQEIDVAYFQGNSDTRVDLFPLFARESPMLRSKGKVHVETFDFYRLC